MRKLALAINRALPAALHDAILLRRRAPLLREAGIVFVHVPKAAGASVNEALYGRLMGHYTASEVKRFAPADVGALPSFALVRNPWDRAVSAWRFARAGRGSGEGVIAGVRRPAQYAIPAFETFETFVCEWLSRQDIMKLDGIFKPQWHYVCDKMGMPLVSHVGRLEQLDATLAFVKCETGRDLPIGRTNVSGPQLNYGEFYSDKTRNAIAEIYKRDFEIFQYDSDGRL